jgi:hypothetical protein
MEGHLVVAKRGEGAWNPYPPVAVMVAGSRAEARVRREDGDHDVAFRFDA